MRQEIELPIQGSNGYKITDFGNVYKGNRLLTTAICGEGHPRVYLRAKHNHRRIDWIVALAFLGKPPALNNVVIDHIDGDLQNCSADNLKYRIENV